MNLEASEAPTKTSSVSLQTGFEVHRTEDRPYVKPLSIRNST